MGAKSIINIISERRKYDLAKKSLTFSHLNILFDNTLYKSLWKTSFFDFHCYKSKYLIELKSLWYSIDMYSTAVMNYFTTQHNYDRLLFVFQYNEVSGPYTYDCFPVKKKNLLAEGR